MRSTYSTGSKSRFTIESLANWPWVSIAFCVLVAWYVLTKLGNSATWLGDWISKLTNPSEYDKQVSTETAFDNSHPAVTGSGWTPAKVRSDAQAIATAFSTYKNAPWYVTPVVFFWSDEPVYSIVKNYTNPVLLNNLRDAYGRIATDGRDLHADLLNLYGGALISKDHANYLRSKGIL